MPLITPEPPNIQRWTETATNQSIVTGAKAAEEIGTTGRFAEPCKPLSHAKPHRQSHPTDADASILAPVSEVMKPILGLQLTFW
jgi:hypothetical protein